MLTYVTRLLLIYCQGYDISKSDLLLLDHVQLRHIDFQGMLFHLFCSNKNINSQLYKSVLVSIVYDIL